jgi:hypothetical protein
MKKTLSIIALLVFLSGCAASRHQSFTQSNALKIRVGMTIKEVVSIFGKPDEISLATCGQNTGKTWQCLEYRYTIEKLKWNTLWFSTSYDEPLLNNWTLAQVYPDKETKDKHALDKKTKKREKIVSLTQDMGKAWGGMRSLDGRYTNNGDDTITDSQSGLMWTKTDSYNDLRKCLDWNASKSYVNNLRTGGYSDWRMPTVKELKTIYEESKSNNHLGWELKDPDFPKIGTFIFYLDSIFAVNIGYLYWSSETVKSSHARLISFTDDSYNSTDDPFINTIAQNWCGLTTVRAVRP